MAGLTVEQIQTKLVDVFSAYIKQPVVTVEIIEFKSQPLYLLGHDAEVPLRTDTFQRLLSLAAVVVVLGTDEAARRSARKPVFVSGTGWGSATSLLARRDLGTSQGTEVAAGLALAEAGIEDAAAECDVFYVSDLYAHRQLLHMDALGLGDAELPALNPDGGCLGMGDLFEANGGARLYDAVLQLRGEAGAHQIAGANVALVQGWRGLPTDSAAVAVLERERRTA